MKQNKSAKFPSFSKIFGATFFLTQSAAILAACGGKTEIRISDDLKEALDKVKLTHEEIENLPQELPSAPEGTYWEYRVGEESFTAEVPETTDLDETETVEVRLSPKTDYVINGDLANLSEVVTISEITIPDSLKAELEKVEIDTSLNFNLPKNLPPNTHWEYGINFENDTSNSEINFAPQLPIEISEGQLIVIRLATDDNHSLSQPVEKTVIVSESSNNK